MAKKVSVLYAAQARKDLKKLEKSVATGHISILTVLHIKHRKDVYR